MVITKTFKYSYSYSTNKIKNEIDKGNYACGIFVDLKKAFDTVDHHLLLKNVEFNGVRGISNEWFASSLSSRNLFATLNGYKSNLADAKRGVRQGSIQGPVLFLIDVNDLHLAIKYSEVHHFADNTNPAGNCMFKVNNKDTSMAPRAPFWCLYCSL